MLCSPNVILREDYDARYDRFVNDDSWWQMVEPSISLDAADAQAVSLRPRTEPHKFLRHRKYMLRSDTVVRKVRYAGFYIVASKIIFELEAYVRSTCA